MYIYLMIEIISFTIDIRPDLASLANGIRQKVFVEEQKVDPSLEYDEYEGSARHYLLFAEGTPVATARWRETDKGIKLERFATLAEYRNRGLGEKVLQSVLNDVTPYGKLVYLHSQLMAIPFYERKGFVKVGDQFTEAEIEHFRMELGRDGG